MFFNLKEPPNFKTRIFDVHILISSFSGVGKTQPSRSSRPTGPSVLAATTARMWAAATSLSLHVLTAPSATPSCEGDSLSPWLHPIESQGVSVPSALYGRLGLAQVGHLWNLGDAGSFVTGVLCPPAAQVALELPGEEMRRTWRNRATTFHSTNLLLQLSQVQHRPQCLFSYPFPPVQTAWVSAVLILHSRVSQPGLGAGRPPRKLYKRPGGMEHPAPAKRNRISWGCTLILKIEPGMRVGAPSHPQPLLLALITQTPPSGNRNPHEQ